MFFRNWLLLINFHCTEKSSNNILQNIYFFIQKKTFWITNNSFSFKIFYPKTNKWRTLPSFFFLFVFGYMHHVIIERLFMQDHVPMSFCVLKSIRWTLFIYLFSFSCSSYFSLPCLMQNFMHKFNASMSDCLHWLWMPWHPSPPLLSL